MPFLNRDQILAADDLSREVVAVPEWGGEVVVVGCMAAERDRYEMMWANWSQKDVAVSDIRGWLVCRCLRDEDGKRMFSDKDTRALGAKSAKVVDRLWDVARRLSGLSDEDVEELEKNSDDAPADDLPLT